ncbi:MAG TPA: sigma-70 family RNA polymerase sigma factor [Candidatus Dormibacteraeota bacterium]
MTPSDVRPLRLGIVDGMAPPDWEAVYRDNIVSIYRLMYSRVGNQPDAEDLTSQVFLGALPHLRPGASGGEVHRYLLATARTVLADHWRRRMGVELTTLDEETAAAPGEGGDAGEATATERVRRVRRLLSALPANHRTILELRFLSGCSLREAAARMGISVGNAKVVQYRALRRAAELEHEVAP